MHVHISMYVPTELTISDIAPVRCFQKGENATQHVAQYIVAM